MIQKTGFPPEDNRREVNLIPRKTNHWSGGKFKQGSKRVVSAFALSIRSVEVTWSYLFVCCSMPSLASSTAKERLHIEIMIHYYCQAQPQPQL